MALKGAAPRRGLKGLLRAFKGGPSVLWALQVTIALATVVGSKKVISNS